MKRIIPITAAPAVNHGGVPSGLSAPPPLSLYIHVPWCVRKCPYCDFNSHEAKGSIPEDDYIAALIADLESALPQVWNRPVHSVFIGGGTPSLLSVAAIDTLLAAVRARLPLLPGAEITLEANPGTVEAEKFAGFRDAGVTRVSLGIQSFDDSKLTALGRIHSADEAKRAIDLALAHFERVNIDLMYALPEQTLAQARRDLETALAFGTGHLSAYHLTLEPNTAFHHRPPPLPDEDLAADMQDMVEETLAGAGFEHYETSAYARPGQRCAHNLNYWNFGDYLGIGAGAHGKLSSAFNIVRETRRRHPREYLESARRGEFAQERREVSSTELPFEFLMNALRLSDGFAPSLFAERTGLPLAVIEAPLRAAQTDGLLQLAGDCIRPTPLGRRYLNTLLQRFLTD
ncbi:radical SAM family heme chaperone HemW [Denitratisoma oestradiolicum]|uniref:Heme chaperone HemW n=1 Tax=Denitratisoma oestradiolicum TaxID=311182 RepID=A0A6S6Y1C6_9PROT|nr:radical SAM family heme chaperone HemW [Denitratisoma oestradiolicum]TWO81664.1 YggW family oxidoreductase [Denitratisoma oestradiolicum]CAB1370611.1 putative oxidoreductase [Denitratisoma oestradiolicum]